MTLGSTQTFLTVTVALLLALGASVAAAQPQTANAQAGAVTGGKTVAIPRLEGAPELDGILDEALWSRAAVIDDFHQMIPIEYSTPSQRTVVRVFYTEDALYIGAQMYEDDPSLITANIVQQGQSLPNDDLLDVMIDPYLDRRGGYLFEINPNDVRNQGTYQNVSRVDRSWEGIWQANSRINDEGWATEIRIPYQTISFDPANTQWGINFRRAIRRKSEEIAWISRNRELNPSIAGTATGLTGLKQGLGLDVVPYVVARKERVYGRGGYDDQSVEPQLDLFYKITPQLNAALTLNTDFSATEVDNRQVNLTRFSLFFPERRDFFIRDSDIFEFGRIGTGGVFGQESNDARPSAALQNGRPFFSRRIGLSPGGSPVDINAGAKVSGRIGDWNVGTLVVNQDADPVAGIESKTLLVGRAALNVFNESQIGLIATSGNPQANVDNSLIGADFRFRNSRLAGGHTFESEVWYQQTDTENAASGDDSAYGVGVSYPNVQGWRGAYSFKHIDANFNPALGFVNQRNIDDHALDGGYRHFFPRGGYLRSVYGGFDAYRNTDASTGAVISETRDVRVNANNNTGDVVSAALVRSHEVISRNFVIYRATDGNNTIVIPPGNYTFDYATTGITFGGQRRLSGSIGAEWGDYYAGNRFQRSAGINWRHPRVQLGMNYTENEIHLPQGGFTVRLTSLTSLVNFNSAWSWSNRIQYDNVSEGIGINSRLRWIPEAGKEGFLVLNWGLVDLDKNNVFESINSDLSLKFNYTLRF